MKAPTSFKTEILLREMSDKDLEKLVEVYEKAKLTDNRGTNRAKTLEEPLSDFEIAALKHYVENTDETLKKFAEVHDVKYPNVGRAARWAALKVVAQKQVSYKNG